MSGKLYDVSMPIWPGMPVYKNKAEKRPGLTVTADHPTHNLRETQLSLNLHTGTHIDAPLHMVAGGSELGDYQIEQFLGKCRVLDLTEVEGAITQVALAEQDIRSGEFVLLKTANSLTEGFDPKFVYLSQEGAVYLSSVGVKGVGIDALGIERNQPGHETHKVLFEHGIVILEGLRLREVPSGTYFLIALPLAISGVEAAPARVVLLENGFGVE